ncbi:protein of unknown function [Nitrospina watsonii]|uniref:Uncharacterized protein n=1 Tax=Nitrospina watsonii TaxID=1323948 RepID=A0ABN8W0L4_9BACT|nr:protein of unknown function [Nitrospina watsonii]
MPRTLYGMGDIYSGHPVPRLKYFLNTNTPISVNLGLLPANSFSGDHVTECSFRNSNIIHPPNIRLFKY